MKKPKPLPKPKKLNLLEIVTELGLETTPERENVELDTAVALTLMLYGGLVDKLGAITNR